MKIAYLLGEEISVHPGLNIKINNQIKRWTDEGHVVYKILHHSGVVLGPDGVLKTQSELVFPVRKIGRIYHLIRLIFQYKFAANALQEISPDLTYSRYLFPVTGINEINKNAGSLIIEINSDDSTEYFIKSKVTGLYNKLFRSNVLRMAKGLVFVTHELACSKAFSAYSNHRIVIPNGVDSDKMSFVKVTGNRFPQIVFIGSPGQAWHGLDKLLKLADILSDCVIHVIGPSQLECEYIWGCVPSNIKIYGYLNDEEAGRLVSRMDVGISTLALHRKGMNEACPLKVRQYLAYGIPVLAASVDSDIKNDVSFYYALPNCENNINMYAEQIKNFVRTVFKNSEIRDSARQFAIQNLDILIKEKKRIDFFREIESNV